MILRQLMLIAIVLLSSQSSAWAHAYQSGSLEIEDLWIRATATGQPNGAGYLHIDNHGNTPDRLLGIKTDIAKKTEIHETRITNGMATMRAVSAVDIPPNSRIDFAPTGYHVMFNKLKIPLQEGAEIPATLIFEKSGEVAVSFTVKPIIYQPTAIEHHH